MKRIYQLYISALFIVLSTSGCLKDNVNLPPQNADDYNQVYMPQAVNQPNVSNLPFKAVDQYLVFGANYGGVGYPATDIPISFTVSADSVAAYNQRNSTSYPLMPKGSYLLSNESAIISKGTLSTAPMKITVKTQGMLDVFKEYLLPVTVNISGTVNGVKLNNSLSTTYYLVKATLNLSDFPDYDRSAWRVTYFSSEEVNGEGPVNGRAALVLDSNINTFWHTRYSDNFAPPPHILIIDMNQTKTLHGVSFVARQNENRGRPMQVTVQTSTDGINWNASEDFNLQSINDQQRLFFLSGFKEARYLKLSINKMYDNATHTHLAEFSAF